jgi:hypothetical protein
MSTARNLLLAAAGVTPTVERETTEVYIVDGHRDTVVPAGLDTSCM